MRDVRESRSLRAGVVRPEVLSHVHKHGGQIQTQNYSPCMVERYTYASVTDCVLFWTRGYSSPPSHTKPEDFQLLLTVAMASPAVTTVIPLQQYT